MKDEKLYRISLLTSVIGVLVLLIFSYTTNPEVKEISEIGPGDIGSKVEVTGTVEDKYVAQDGHMFFHVKKNGDKIDVALFADNLEGMGLDPEVIEENDRITVSGDIDMYEGELQIIPTKLEIKET